MTLSAAIEDDVMSEMKFSCPACGQRISCSNAYCDQAIHCPGCRTEIRVPCSQSSDPPKLKFPSSINNSSPPTPAETKGADKPVPVVNDKTNDKELHCRCPVCESHLRIPASVASQRDDVFPSAELVLKTGETKTPASKPAVEPAETTPVMTEREQKIAAERAARTVSLYPKMKPRLDLVLGEKPPAESKDNEGPSWMKEAA